MKYTFRTDLNNCLHVLLVKLIERYIVMNVHQFKCKVPVTFSEIAVLYRQIFEN